jgi:type IV pilus assembly protein PilW
VLIAAGALPADPDAITVFYAGSASLVTPVPLARDATVAGPGAAEPYEVAAPVAFNPGDVIVAVDAAQCTLSAIDPGGVAVAGSGIATLAHTPLSGALDATYRAGIASLVNLGPAATLARVRYSVDVAARALRAQQLLPAAEPVNPIVGDIVSLKAHYGIDTDDDGAVDTWQPASGDVWSAASLPAQPLATLRRIRSVRVAIVARSPRYEREAVTPGPLPLFDGTLALPLTADGQHYRYRVLETIVPLRNALWNAS